MGAWRKRVLLSFAMVAGAVMLPTTVVLMAGMLPTFIILLFDRTPEKARVITVGAMNLAGCMPFILEIWHRGHTVEIALKYITEPRTIVIMYFAAAIGYMIDWVVSGLVAAVMVQRAKSKLADLEKRRKMLEERWGKEVTGQYALDDEGFLIEANRNR